MSGLERAARSGALRLEARGLSLSAGDEPLKCELASAEEAPGRRASAVRPEWSELLPGTLGSSGEVSACGPPTL